MEILLLIAIVVIIILLSKKKKKASIVTKTAPVARPTEHGHYEDYKVAGVRFRNDAGENRQALLRNISLRIGDFSQKSKIDLQPYNYKGEDAFRVVVNGHDIGNIHRDDIWSIKRLLSEDRLSEYTYIGVSQFRDDSGKPVYYATLRIWVLDDDPKEKEKEAASRAEQRRAEAAEQKETFYAILNEIELIVPELDLAAECKTKQAKEFPGFKASPISKSSTMDAMSEFFVVDVETTGLNVGRNEIIQLTAMQFVNFEPVQCLNTFVKPRRGLCPEAQAINGITEADVENAPYIEQVLPAFDDFIGTKLPLVGHNLAFDLKFLFCAGSEAVFSNRKKYDTLPLARSIWGEYARNCKLDTLMRDLCRIERDDAHDARSDCLATGILFKSICEEKLE